MKVEITLSDNEGKPCLLIENCVNDDFVDLKFIIGSEAISAIVRIDDLRLAIRKLTEK
jgi:hypothetical protein